MAGHEIADAATNPDRGWFVTVLHVIPSLAAAHGGPSRAMALIEQALKGQGIATETATTDDDGARGRVDRAQVDLCREDSADRRYFRKTTDPYKISIAFLRWITAHVRDYQVLHIHALFSFTSTVAALVARRSGIPYVIRPVGTLAPYGMGKRRPWAKKLSVALFERRILRDAAAIHCTSVDEQNQVAALGFCAPGVVIPLALDPAPSADVAAFLARFPNVQPGFVLFVGRLNPVKNLESLLGAIALCADALPEQQWVIVGDGAPDYSAQLRQLADKLAISDRVLWAGHLEGGVKAAAFSLAKLFVLPSFSENFGIAAAEALQGGLPVVLGTGVAISRQVASAGAGKAVEPVPDAIAGAVRAYLLDPVALAQAAAKAKRLAEEEFSLAVMGARLAALYDNILSAPDQKWTGAVGDA